MQIIKKILKKLVPIVVLNQLHLRYNKLRIRTVDRIIFPERLLQPEAFRIQRNDYPFRLTQVVLEHLDTRLQQQFIENAANWTQDEYLLVYNQPCIIEPQQGWALTPDNHLIYPSLGFSRVPYLRKPALKARRMHTSPFVDEYAEVISLRDTGEENYFHFYNDVLAKLFFLEDKIGLGPEIPIVVGARLYHRAFFQYFLQHPYLKNRRWIVQETGQYIRSNKTYFCKPLTHTPHYYERIRQLAQPIDLLNACDSERRIFITRSPRRQRFIENNEEIEHLCQMLGFESIDFDDLTLPEQIKIMTRARYVVGIHGAGLTNMLFRGHKPMGLLEIYPPSDYFPFHYILMATQLGYQYTGIIGQVGKQKYLGGFYVDPAELKQCIQAML